MNLRYWLVMPNGARQLIDPQRFDLASMAERARRLGGRLIAERLPTEPHETADSVDRLVLSPASAPRSYEPPIPALAGLFRNRLECVHTCRVDFTLDIATRPTSRVLGGYYRRRRLVRIYSHDSETGRRPLEELFDTFLHEVAHHLEYTEPSSFQARACQRRKGQMHSPLFWRILSELKQRWLLNQQGPREVDPSTGVSTRPAPPSLERAHLAGWLFPMEDA